MDNPATPAKSDPTPEQKDDFDKRHASELGVKRFAKVQAAYTFVPLLTAAAGAVLGRFALAKPLAKMMPEWNKTLGAGEVMVGKALEAVGKLSKGKNAEEAFAGMNLNAEQFDKIGAAWADKSLSYDKKLVRIAEAANIKLPEVSGTLRNTATGGASAVGLVGGSIAVGYDRWHKDESARLAAQEVNKDIANLELFRPSDKELVAENNRLRAMVAALPTVSVDPATVESQGRVKDNQQSVSAG